MSMNPVIKKRWVDALRSGKYNQGSGYLMKDKRFCCLGVLCDIVKDELGVDWEIEEESGKAFIFQENEVLSPEVQIFCDINDEFGLRDISVETLPDEVKIHFLNTTAESVGTTSLVNLNDRGMPFDIIADIIEENL